MLCELILAGIASVFTEVSTYDFLCFSLTQERDSADDVEDLHE